MFPEKDLEKTTWTDRLFGVFAMLIFLVLVIGALALWQNWRNGVRIEHNTAAIQYLLKNGKTASAKAAKLAATTSAQVASDLQRVESLLQNDLSDNHGASLALLCSMAHTLGDTSPAVSEYCVGGNS